MSEILDIAAALSRLLKAENVLLICHKNPDGDTIGSAAALYWALKGLGKTVAVLCADPIPSRYDYMDIGLTWRASSCSAIPSRNIHAASTCASTTIPPTQGMLTACCWTATPPPQPRSFTSC